MTLNLSTITVGSKCSFAPLLYKSTILKPLGTMDHFVRRPPIRRSIDSTDVKGPLYSREDYWTRGKTPYQCLNCLSSVKCSGTPIACYDHSHFSCLPMYHQITCPSIWQFCLTLIISSPALAFFLTSKQGKNTFDLIFKRDKLTMHVF